MSESSTKTQQGPGRRKPSGKPSLLARMRLFLRQMVAELRKVIWPTRRELITYTWVVIVFVGVVTAIVGVYDLLFTKLVLRIFG